MPPHTRPHPRVIGKRSGDRGMRRQPSEEEGSGSGGRGDARPACCAGGKGRGVLGLTSDPPPQLGKPTAHFPSDTAREPPPGRPQCPLSATRWRHWRALREGRFLNRGIRSLLSAAQARPLRPPPGGWTQLQRHLPARKQGLQACWARRRSPCTHMHVHIGVQARVHACACGSHMYKHACACVCTVCKCMHLRAHKHTCRLVCTVYTYVHEHTHALPRTHGPLDRGRHLLGK